MDKSDLVALYNAIAAQIGQSVIDVDVEIDLMEHIEGMDKSDLVALYNAIAAQIGQSVIADDSDQPIGINVEIGRREIGRLINDRWNSLSHHAQAVASAMGY